MTTTATSWAERLDAAWPKSLDEVPHWTNDQRAMLADHLLLDARLAELRASIDVLRLAVGLSPSTR